MTAPSDQGHEDEVTERDPCATGLERVETERMVAERLRPGHQHELARLLGDARVARTLWPGEPPPGDAQLRYILSDKLDHWDRYGFGLWLLRDRMTGAMVGRGGLQHTIIGRRGELEAGWAIAPERWGEGLGTELAHACVAVAFGKLELEQIIAMALPSNVASLRVMEKSGFAYERELVHRGIAHVLYRATCPRPLRERRGLDRSRESGNAIKASESNAQCLSPRLGARPGRVEGDLRASWMFSP